MLVRDTSQKFDESFPFPFLNSGQINVFFSILMVLYIELRRQKKVAGDKEISQLLEFSVIWCIGMLSEPENLVGSSKVAIPGTSNSIKGIPYLDMDYLPCVATLNHHP